MKKNILIISFVIGSLLCFSSCNDFTKMNEDPTKWTTVDPNNQITYIELVIWGNLIPAYTYFAYFQPFVQQFMGEWRATNQGGLYTKDDEITKLMWDRTYTYSIKNLVDILEKTEGKPEYVNVRAVARILKVYHFMILTDTYGDLPYFQGGKGYAGISTPTYDEQRLIYLDFLNELRESEAELSSEGGVLTGDIIYSNDIHKWKRFANSLRLRVAMRMVYAEPALARDEVMDIMLSPSGLLNQDEDAMVPYMDFRDKDNYEFRRNALSESWISHEAWPHAMICSVFFDHMLKTGDPRTFRIARCYPETPASRNNPFSRLDITEEVIEEVKAGNLKWDPVKPGKFFYEELGSTYYYSEIREDYVSGYMLRPQLNNVFLKGSTPGLILSYAEVQFLLIEAVSRWPEMALDGTPIEDLYANGVRAAMNLLLKYGVESYKSNEISDYLAANPFPAGEEARIQAINEQLWVLNFFNPPEVYANWRRSGYPVLKPSGDYGATTVHSKTIPRRLCYPLEETRYNAKSQQVALDRMGGSDDWNARVWWDKK